MLIDNSKRKDIYNIKMENLNFLYMLDPPIKEAESIINQALTLPNAVLFVKNKNGETFQIKQDCELNYIQWQTI